MRKINYPVRCRIVDAGALGHSVAGIPARTPDESRPFIGQEGTAEKVGPTVRICLDSGDVLWGYECWWEPLDEQEAQ